MSWTLIEHQALTSSVASVTLGSGGTIPQTYKTLKLVISPRLDGSYATDTLTIRFNNSTSTFTYRLLYGTGTAAASVSNTFGNATDSNAATSTSSTFSNIEVTIPNYAGSTNKPYSVDGVTENNGTAANQALLAGLWSTTSAITSIGLVPYSGSNFVSGSTFTLYGLA